MFQMSEACRSIRACSEQWLPLRGASKGTTVKEQKSNNKKSATVSFQIVVTSNCGHTYYTNSMFLSLRKCRSSVSVSL